MGQSGRGVDEIGCYRGRQVMGKLSMKSINDSCSSYRLQDAKFLISQQKYLELLEAGQTTTALHVLRNEIAPLDVDSDQLHLLSR